MTKLFCDACLREQGWLYKIELDSPYGRLKLDVCRTCAEHIRQNVDELLVSLTPKPALHG